MRIDNEPIAGTICNIIITRGVKQSFVAEAAGYSKGAFNAMLTGRKIIRPQDVSRIAKALGVTPNDLYGIEQKSKEQAC